MYRERVSFGSSFAATSRHVEVSSGPGERIPGHFLCGEVSGPGWSRPGAPLIAGRAR
jgi:hypothetical protein